MESAKQSTSNQRYNSRFFKFLKKACKSPQLVAGSAIVFFFVLVAVFAPLIAPYDPLEISIVNRFQSFSSAHLLGTDNLGRDILSRLIFGARISLMVGITATAIGGTIGVIIGVISGYYGGKIDTAFMRLVDMMLAFPGLLLALGIVAALGRSTFNVILAIAVFAIPSFARVVRGSTLSVAKLEYIDAIRAIGASDLRIIFLHILPNILSPIIVQASLNVGTAITGAAGLAFLGVGTPPPTPDWGIMLNQGRDSMHLYPRLVILPGLVIFFLVIGINLFGNGLRDVMQPKKRA
ncbi:MAG: ABC transporter permease [Defluviitaleaceae bacterium]|nr:ABC transporter permease [Defluviitaleaceae bacterium]